MGKSFMSALKQVQETRRRSKKRGGGDVGREKREAQYAHMRKKARKDDDGQGSAGPEASQWAVEDISSSAAGEGAEPAVAVVAGTDVATAEKAKPHRSLEGKTAPSPATKSGVATGEGAAAENASTESVAGTAHANAGNDADTVEFLFREVNPEQKQTAFLEYMQEYREEEKNHRQKRKVVVFVKETRTAKALCSSLGQHRRVYKSKGKGIVKKKYNETKGVAVLLKYLKDEEQELVCQSFRNGKVSTVVVTDDCSTDLWPQKDTISMVVNFDLPPHAALFENRAGLVGKSGAVLSFITPTKATRELAPDLVDFLTKENQNVPKGLLALAQLQRRQTQTQNQPSST